MGKAFAAAPLLLLPAVAYNVLVMALGGFTSPDAAAHIADRLFELPTASGGVWEISYADLLLAGALIVMFVELIKSTHSRRVALITHILSITLFVACLAELLLVPACATSTFFLIALMVLLDVLAGFILGVSTRGPAAETKPKR